VMLRLGQTLPAACQGQRPLCRVAARKRSFRFRPPPAARLLRAQVGNRDRFRHRPKADLRELGGKSRSCQNRTFCHRSRRRIQSVAIPIWRLTVSAPKKRVNPDHLRLGCGANEGLKSKFRGVGITKPRMMSARPTTAAYFSRREAASARSLCSRPGARQGRSRPCGRKRSARGFRRYPGER
jgi:hypothetical protein